jgi:hypothetical protein
MVSELPDVPAPLPLRASNRASLAADSSRRSVCARDSVLDVVVCVVERTILKKWSQFGTRLQKTQVLVSAQSMTPTLYAMNEVLGGERQFACSRSACRPN